MGSHPLFLHLPKIRLALAKKVKVASQAGQSPEQLSSIIACASLVTIYFGRWRISYAKMFLEGR
jgi:hypothetical protein